MCTLFNQSQSNPSGVKLNKQFGVCVLVEYLCSEAKKKKIVPAETKKKTSVEGPRSVPIYA